MTIDLLIASFRIRLTAREDIKLQPGERFSAFIADVEGVPDVVIYVSSAAGVFPENAMRVFEAPLIEETPAGVCMTDIPFWSVWLGGSTVYVRIAAGDSSNGPLLEMNPDADAWNLYLNTEGNVTDPLFYPMDGLILYYLSIIKGAVMIHASAVSINGRGWLFTGRSGRGKTTIARLFDSKGVEVVHDDRVILVKTNGKWHIYSTPVYSNDVPRDVELEHIWLIEHGRSNISKPVTGAQATAMVMANCIQQNWNSEYTTHLLTVIEDITGKVPVSSLAFLPDTTVCDYLMLRTEEKMSSAAEAAIMLIREGKRVTISAGGTSMWPAIRPGDKVILENVNNRPSLAEGDIVALVRDGGFVVHRITGVAIRDNKNYYKTQGDASLRSDPWSEETEVAGEVINIIRKGRSLKVPKRKLPCFLNRLFVLIRGILSRAEART